MVRFCDGGHLTIPPRTLQPVYLTCGKCHWRDSGGYCNHSSTMAIVTVDGNPETIRLTVPAGTGACDAYQA